MATIKLADGRGELYQWDTGRKVVIDDETIKQAHYQNRFYGRTIDVDVSDGTAIIPDQLLQSFAPLVVFAWVGSAEDGYTKIEKTFEVHRRNKPADYVFTPVEQKTLDDLQKQIGNLADLTTEAKDTLVAAINEAAASGGAGSMDLRVADGYVQYSTDGGSTWENLIAVAELKGADGAPGTAGPAGAPGKDGAGMDITGATVGQIAKITAVDTDGVPTAWSPVDMPSGRGETWELIRDFTLTEDVVKVTINLDENGKPFRLKKAYVFITATAPTDESITYSAAICCSLAKESPSVWGEDMVRIGESPAFGTPTRYAMSLWDTYAGIFAPVEIKSSFSVTVADALVTKNGYSDPGAIMASGNGLGYLQSPCESFSFGSYRKTLFTGANIKIWGVRV